MIDCQVSIVIVCMNNLKNLYPCLDSIKMYTTVSYETLVVAYLFSKENLDKLRNDYPWITIIESNEIRGFSENNNLALRQAKGKYSFVVNDDTEMKMPVIDQLVESFKYCPSNTAIISPVLVDLYDKVQFCGRPPFTLITFLLSLFHIYNKKKTIYVNQEGIFKSYNITGAAFLIRSDVFKKVGWFDERFFFCPEDIALSTLLNKSGYSCYVNSNVKLTHYEGMSGKSLSLIMTATKPAGHRGSLIFYGDTNIKLAIVRLISLIAYIAKFIYHRIRGLVNHYPNVFYILSIADKNCIMTCFSRKTPKEIFKKFYNKLYDK